MLTHIQVSGALTSYHPNDEGISIVTNPTAGPVSTVGNAGTNFTQSLADATKDRSKRAAKRVLGNTLYKTGKFIGNQIG